MDITDLIPELLIVLGLAADNLVKEASSYSSVEVTASQFVNAILITNNNKEAAAILHISRTTLVPIYTKVLLGVDRGFSNKQAFLLSLVGYKLCTLCAQLGKENLFNKTNNTCKICARAYGSSHYAANRDSISAQHRAYHKDNKVRIAERRHLHYLANKEEYKAKDKVYRRTPKGRATSNAKAAKRRAAKITRTPAWADLEKIKAIYLACPEGHHVDHIIPLQGKIVSGLHVEGNLQYLTATANLQKSNKFEVI